MFPEGPVFKWFVTYVDILRLEILLNLAVTAVAVQYSRGNSTLLPSDVIEFSNVARSEILAGNSFIVRCHVTSK